MTVWSFYTFEARLVPRADRVAVLAGQAGAKAMAVRPYLPLPPGGPAPRAIRQWCLQFRMLIVGLARLSQSPTNFANRLNEAARRSHNARDMTAWGENQWLTFHRIRTASRRS